MRRVATAIDAFPFQHPEEALAGRVVGAAADAAHRTGQVVALQEALVLVAGKLAPAVTVQDHRLPRLSLPKRHQHGLKHQLTILATAHRPADNNAGVQVDDDTQVKSQAADDTDVGNAGDPLGGRLLGDEVTGQVILDIRRTCTR